MAHDYDIDMLKENDQQIERADSNDQTEVTHDVKFEKRVLRKIDTRLLPILGCLYTIALVDRSNVAVARISGMDEDLDLTQGNRVSVALMVFFIGYILFEIPSNAFIHKLGAANWLAFLAVAWGLVSLGIGFLNNWIGLAVLRAFLGVFEAGFFPGCVYLVSSWYKRYEVQKRMAGFFLTASALSAFANILAYGLIQISKTHHYKGWRWIFIIEGTITVVAGIGSWFIIVDFPDSDKNTFLTVEERAFVKARLAEDRGPEEHEKVTWKILAHTAADWKPWAYSLMYMAGAVGVYAFLFFLPIILRGGLGYSIEMSFILSTPPALFSVVEAMTISWLADKLQMRGPFVIFQGLVGIIGLCMTAFLNSPTPRYIGTFLGVAGANGLVVTTLAWQANNIVGDARRAVSTGILISMSGVGGIYSSMVFRQQDAPNYLPGILAVMAINVVAVIVAGITMLILRYNNRQAEKGEYLCENREGFSFRYLRTTTTILRKHVLDHKATILLVHGAWHRSWAWNHQIPELESLGYPTTTVDLPSTSGIPGKTQLDDVKHVQATLEQMIAENKDVVVLAHSYGGPIDCGGIVGLSSQERAQKNLQGGVVGFINLCGYIFPGGMDQGAIIESVGGLPYVNWDTPSPGLFVAKDPGSMLYQPDVPKDLADWALTQLQPQSMAANLGIVPPQAWQDDSYRGRLGYIKATADAVIPIADQESMIDKSGGSDKWITRVLEGSGHSPMLSHPEEVARVVDSLIQDFQRNTI